MKDKSVQIVGCPVIICRSIDKKDKLVRHHVQFFKNTNILFVFNIVSDAIYFVSIVLNTNY